MNDQDPTAPPSGPARRGLLAIVSVAVVLVVVVVVVLLARGGDDADGSTGGDAAGPLAAVDAYYDALLRGDCEGLAATLSNAELEAADEDARAGALDERAQACQDPENTSGAQGAGCERDVTDTEVDGDRATVTFDISGCDEAGSDIDGLRLVVVREAGEWRVDGPP